MIHIDKEEAQEYAPRSHLPGVHKVILYAQKQRQKPVMTFSKEDLHHENRHSPP